MSTHRIFPLAVAAVAAVAAGIGATASLAATTSAAGATAAKPPALPPAFVACLKDHGVTLPTTGFGRPGGFGTRPPGTQGGTRPPLTAAQIKERAARQAAFKACSKYAPKGFGFRFGRGGNGGFGGYAACMRKQGINLAPGSKVNLTSPKFKAAAKKCKSLLPKTGTTAGAAA